MSLKACSMSKLVSLETQQWPMCPFVVQVLFSMPNIDDAVLALDKMSWNGK